MSGTSAVTIQVNKQGFTLLELLVALVVLGFLAVGLTEGVRLGVKSWDMQSAAVADHVDLDMIDRTLRHLIAGLDPGIGTVKGTTDTFDFTSALSNIAALQIRRSNMHLLVDDQHRLLLRCEMHQHVDTQAPPKTQEIELLDRIERVEFGYRGDKGSDSNHTADWQSEWNDAAPPRLIRIRIVFLKGDHRYWPDIVIAVIRDQPPK